MPNSTRYIAIDTHQAGETFAPKAVIKRHSGALAIVLVALVLLPQAIIADQAPGTRPQTRPSETQPIRDKTEKRQIIFGTNGDGIDGWVRTLIALGVVIALIFLLRFLIKRFSSGAEAVGKTKRAELLGGTALSSKHRLYVVRFDGQVLLIGAWPGGLTTLAGGKNYRDKTCNDTQVSTQTHERTDSDTNYTSKHEENTGEAGT